MNRSIQQLIAEFRRLREENERLRRLLAQQRLEEQGARQPLLPISPRPPPVATIGFENTPSRIGEITIRSKTSPPPQLRIAIPRLLNECPFFQDILRTPCFVTLNDQRYGKISTTKRSRISSGNISSMIQYSLIQSFLMQLAKENPGTACLTGNITIRFLGDSDDRDLQIINDPQISHIHPSWRNSEEQELCFQHRLIYIPVLLQWVSQRNQLQPFGNSVTCNGCSGHAAALIIDNQNKNIQFYDPNGTFPSYFVAASDWIQRHIFQAIPKLREYHYIDEAHVPQFVGFQANTQLQMCTYFASLYVALRFMCPRLSAEEINHSLAKIPKNQIFDLLSLFHCYIIEKSRQSGLLNAYANIAEVHAKAFNLLINARSYGITANEEESLWTLFKEAEYFANFDILTSYQKFQEIVQSFQ